MSTPIFALIIGIDSYKSGSIWNLHSCVDDAERIRRWLLHDLDVPKDQIRLLSDSQASKNNIEDTFMEHLVNNPSIQRDDPILIYFAGHGSRLSAPKDWYPGIRKPRTVEVLCTYDFDSKDEHGRISGISDRSMNAMLRELAAVKGDNITLVLDCCFTPFQTPENLRERSRTRWTPPSRARSEDLWRGLWPGARALPQHSQFGFLEPCPTTHVVVAACSPGHIATEGKEGGRLTANLLYAFSNLTLHRTTYAQLLDHLNHHAGEGQHFVCLGKNKSRVIFNDVPFTVDRQFLSVTSGRGRDLRIEAGKIHGIMEGTEISLHVHNYNCSKNPAFAVAVVLKVYPTWSLARVKPQSQDVQVPRCCWGRIARWNNPQPFRVKLKSSVASLTRVWKLKKDIPLDSTRTLKSSGITIERVEHAKQADISLTVYRRDVVVERNDSSIVGKLGERVVRIEDTNPIKVINDAARFNLHLQTNNPEKPLENATRMEVYSIDADTLSKVGGNLLRDGRAAIHCNYNPIFTVILTNTSKYDLWPYIVSMDPNTYATHMIYPHPEEEEQYAPLPAGGILEIAANWPEPEGDWHSRKHWRGHSGFLKVYFVSASVHLNMFEQSARPPSALGFPSRSSMFMDAASTTSSIHTLVHVWDTILTHVSFIPGFDSSS
ncbi:hypothetical protein H1R20_g11945, partial [Candolleomyces eurysporus]